MTKLCPACGKKPRLSHEFYKNMVSCDNPDCMMYGIGFHIEFWNGPRAADWIPCSERLPEDNTEVLILSNVRSFIDQSKRTARIFTGSHNHKTWICDGDVIFHGSGTFYDYESVTHWRPLPEPPEEQPENTTITITGDVPRGKPLAYFGDEEQQP